MDSYTLYLKACDFSNTYSLHEHFSGKTLKRMPTMRKNLLEDIASTLGAKKLNEPVSRIKLKGNYSRKLVVQVFSALGAKVTRYTREYGRTIVHFE